MRLETDVIVRIATKVSGVYSVSCPWPRPGPPFPTLKYGDDDEDDDGSPLVCEPR